MLVTLALAGTGGPAAYPIAPRPLRRLVAEAEFIVTARVVEPEADVRARVLERAEHGARSVVVLELDRLVKGDPGVRTIEQVNFGWACPEPARYHARPEVRELAASFAAMGKYGSAGDDAVGRLQAVLRLLALY